LRSQQWHARRGGAVARHRTGWARDWLGAVPPRHCCRGCTASLRLRACGVFVNASCGGGGACMRMLSAEAQRVDAFEPSTSTGGPWVIQV
jgi:hypothetical protein